MSTLTDAIIAESTPTRSKLGAIAELLERSGIDIAEIGRVDKVKAWQGFYKDADGEAHTVDMTGVVLSPKWADGPAWPVVQPATPVKVPKSTVRPWPSVRRPSSSTCSSTLKTSGWAFSTSSSSSTL